MLVSDNDSPMPEDTGRSQPHGFPPIFQYSQDSLQTYTACARRFQLRHLLRQAWPEPVTETIDTLDQDLQLGAQFHRLLERHFLGMAVRPPTDQPIAAWWQAFLDSPPGLPERATIRKPESLYSIPFGSRRLVAKFDLVVVVPGEQVMIVDWKTSHQRPDQAALASRLQTAVYLYVAVEALSHEYGSSVPPEAISLIYWFTADPARPALFRYSATQHAVNRDRLQKLMTEIESHTEEIWPLTEHIERCQSCTFRVLCDRTDNGDTIDRAPLPIEEEAGNLADLLFDDTTEVEL